MNETRDALSNAGGAVGVARTGNSRMSAARVILGLSRGGLAMFWYLFSFKGRINRAKMWLYWLCAVVWEAFCFGAIWVIGTIAKLNDPIGNAAFFYDTPHSLVEWLGTIVFYVFLFGYGWTLIAVSVKRLHDRGKGAIWALLFWGTPIVLFAALSLLMLHHSLGPTFLAIAGPFVAVIGGGIMWWGLIEMLFIRGTRGKNRFGPDPLEIRS